MLKRRNNFSTGSSLNTVGERGFLKKLLPRLRGLTPRRFFVPPGDDAAVLRNPNRLVLSIDGLTEGTHFKFSWARRCQTLTGFSLGRALGWKLMGSSLSDLAAMGHVEDLWALIYLGAPSQVPISFLNDFTLGLKEMAQKFKCVLAGGDTVKSKDLSLVCAVGGKLKGARSIQRKGAKPGDLVCLAGTIGDAALGLKILQNQMTLRSHQAKAYFVKRFFKPEPLFREARILSREKGVSSLKDLSDSLPESLEILSQESCVGMEIAAERVPVSSSFRSHFKMTPVLWGGGEDYSLLFTASRKSIDRLKKKLTFSVIGRIVPPSQGLQYFFHGAQFKPKHFFQHFAGK